MDKNEENGYRVTCTQVLCEEDKEAVSKSFCVQKSRGSFP
jgi:hypothetical protein